MTLRFVGGCLGAVLPLAASLVSAQITVPAGPAADARPQSFADARYGVRFEVPAGWTVAHRDGEVSNYRLDVANAPKDSMVRGAASMDFNPFPHSTLGGALLYFSVQPQSDERSCAQPAGATGGKSETIGIGGMGFTHVHSEHGRECVEARDEIYTAYRRHACYRFDLEVNTFCAESSGAQELSPEQLHDIDGRMAGILSTVTFSWEKSGAQTVPVPDTPPTPRTPMKHSAPAKRPDAS
jgi:hypothetical protein